MSSSELWVCLVDLVPDRCNFLDKTFEQDVYDFMRRCMPGGPMGLLDTTSEAAFERWEITPGERFKVVERVGPPIYECEKCGCEYTEAEKAAMTEPCCEESGYNLLGQSLYDVVDTDYADPDVIETFDDEGDAEDKAREMNNDAMSENAGFPWANSWFFMPEDYITDDELMRAGFVVAQYRGGAGSWKDDEQYRLAGIDGGGYSFKGQHFALLYAIVAERGHWHVQTDQGRAYITVERKSALEQMVEEGP